MKSLLARVEKVEGWDRIKLEGSIGEGTEETLLPLIDELGVNCLLNLAKVVSTNSCGIAEWINFVEKLGNNRHIYLEQCPPDIVMTLNMVPAFRGSAKVYSVYQSYRCAACEKTSLQLYTHGKNMPMAEDVEQEKLDIPESHCETCNRVLVPDVPHEEFFEFLLA